MNLFFQASLISVTLFFISSEHSVAQFNPSKWEIGINGGAMVYQGDLSSGYFGYTRSPNPSVEIWVSRSLDEYFSIRANILQGGLNADESTYSSPDWRRHRNLKFSTPVTELSGELVWDLYGKTYREGMRRFSPYFFAGAGLSVLHIQRNWSQFDTNYFDSKSTTAIGLGVDTLNKPPAVIAVIPVGAGLRYMINNHFFINLEATYRFTASDYVHGFKYSGNPSKNDRYYGLTLGISYRLGNNALDCPKPL